MSYLTTGVLPKAFQDRITECIKAAKADLVEGYRSRGMSTDPRQNPALQQDLANIDSKSRTLKAQLEEMLHHEFFGDDG
jgi:hypothetical protein